ncbi:MAG: hypothetical protein NVS4B10_18570 [Myxococcales bacterium]
MLAFAASLLAAAAAAADPAPPASQVAASPPAAQLARLGEADLDRAIAEVHARTSVADRIDAWSRKLLGTPYMDQPLGEGGTGPEPQPRFRLDAVDCQTFVETVLAMANARDVREAKLILDDIRYSKQPISFANRNHFT